MEITTEELLKNEQFNYALAESLAEKMFNDKVYEQFFQDDWNTKFANMVKEKINEKIEQEISEYVKSEDIKRLFAKALNSKFNSILNEIQKSQETIEVVF